MKSIQAIKETIKIAIHIITATKIPVKSVKFSYTAFY